MASSRQFANSALVLFFLGVTFSGLTLTNASADPGWSPVVIATGDYRARLQATPIQYLPNRPFHFYGNSVRRLYHSGSIVPQPEQVFRAPISRRR